MDPGALRDVLTLFAGVVTGIVSAAFGVGGAVLSTPAIRALGASPELAIGSTLPSILPSAVSGSLRYRREGLIDARLVAVAAPLGAAAAVAGALLAEVVPGDGRPLMLLTAALLALNAWRMGRDPRSGVHGGPFRPAMDSRRGVCVAVAVVGGLVSGLLGIGGGVLMVPGFIELGRLPLKTAIATSLACVGIFAVPGTVAHALLDNIDWRFALLLGVGVIPGARVGAALAVRAADVDLRRAVAGFIGAIALIYFAGEVAALS